MDTFGTVLAWLDAHPAAAAGLKTFAMLFVIVAVVRTLRRLVMKRLPDVPSKYKLQKALEVGGYGLGALVVVTYLAGGTLDTGLFLGLFSAGLAFTLQELILSIAGSLYVFAAGVYRPGDRIEIDGIKGDVIDVDSVYTVLMEIGEWVKSDNYTGRIVRISNATVFRKPVYNYSQDFPFVWDEITIPIRYGSAVERAEQLIVAVAQQELSSYVEQSRALWSSVVDKYFIEAAHLEPSLARRLTDNWIEFDLRYIVSYKARRSTRDRLHAGILREIEATNGAVELASATFEVVRVPTLRMSGDGDEATG